MFDTLSPDAVLAQYDAGIEAITDAAAKREDRAWHKTVVGDWSAHELARHLVVVAGWYHEWLDRSLDGETDPPFPAKQLDHRNELEILDLRDLDGPEAIEQFVRSATDYGQRLRRAVADRQWDAPFGFPYGTATVGGHAGVAAGEWHLHAWDLSDGRWTPADPKTLYLAIGAGMTATQSAWRRPITRRAVEGVAARRPWKDLLKRSGR